MTVLGWSRPRELIGTAPGAPGAPARSGGCATGCGAGAGRGSRGSCPESIAGGDGGRTFVAAAGTAAAPRTSSERGAGVGEGGESGAVTSPTFFPVTPAPVLPPPPPPPPSFQSVSQFSSGLCLFLQPPPHQLVYPPHMPFSSPTQLRLLSQAVIDFPATTSVVGERNTL